MTKIDILNPKLIVHDDYQQFWVTFEYCNSSSKKCAKMVLFGLKTNYLKNFLCYFYPPTLPMQKMDQNGP